jgi:hypothetical protein
MSIASHDHKVFELITKLILDTNNNRIRWILGQNDGNCENYYANYDNRYQLIFCFSPTRSLELCKNGNSLLLINDIDLSYLHNAIRRQVGSTDIEEAIDDILHY